MDVKVDLGDNTTQLIEQLATQLNMTVDKVFPFYVEMVRFEAAGGALIVGGAFIIATIFSWRLLKKCDWDEPNSTNIAGIMLGSLVLILVLIVLMEGAGTVTKIFIPEPYAIKALAADAGRLIGK